MTDTQKLESRVASAFYGNFKELRPVQQGAIQPILNGMDVILSSGTGSGKTEAVVAPLLSRHWRMARQKDETVILYVAPTKALVNDVEKRLTLPLNNLGLRVGIRHGDRDDFVSGPPPHLLITTPESLEVLLFRHDEKLKGIAAVVVDEVHLLYNTQRGLQLSVLLKRLSQYCGHDVQVVALSATIGELSYVRNFLLGANHEAVMLAFPGGRTIDAKVFHVVNENRFLELIRKLVSGHSSKILVFANSRRVCERLAGILTADPELANITFAHYSSLSTEVRLDTERRFSSSRNAVCIATSTLELGIDIGDIDAVVLWSNPGSVESFLQRIGRGNRRTSKTNVVCLIPDDSTNPTLDALLFLSLIRVARSESLPDRSPDRLYGAIAQQSLSIIASQGGAYTRIVDLLRTFDHCIQITRDQLEAILAELAQREYLQHHGFKNRYGANERLYELVDYKLIYGNFPAGSQTVVVSYNGKALGSVPAANLLRLRSGRTVRFAGKTWRVGRVSLERIEVTPSGSSRGAIDFTYFGGAPTVGPFLVNMVWESLHSDNIDMDILSRQLRSTFVSEINQIRTSLSMSAIPYRRSVEGIKYFTFAGYIVNKAIALIAGKASFEANDWSLTVTSPIEFPNIPIDASAFSVVFDSLFETSEQQTIYQKLLPSELQRDEYLQEWLNDMTIPIILKRLSSGTPVELPPHDLRLFA